MKKTYYTPETAEINVSYSAMLAQSASAPTFSDDSAVLDSENNDYYVDL